MCKQQDETLIAITNLGLRLTDIEKCQQTMSEKIEVLERAVLGNGHPPLEDVVDRLSKIVWGDDQLGLESLQKTVLTLSNSQKGIEDQQRKLNEEQRRFIWVVGGVLSFINFAPQIAEFIGRFID